LFRMSPGGRSFVTHRCRGPSGAASPKKGFADRAMLWREASRREHAIWADARSDVSGANLRPGRIAQRGRQPKVRSPQRFPEVWPALHRRKPPALRARALKTLCSGLTLPRPPHPAPRIVTIASRPSPLRRDMRTIILLGILSYKRKCQATASDMVPP
jgi:hypothetical protein